MLIRLSIVCHILQGEWSASRPPVHVQCLTLHWDCCVQSPIRHSSSTRLWWCRRSDETRLIDWQLTLLIMSNGSHPTSVVERCVTCRLCGRTLCDLSSLWSNTVGPVVENPLIYVNDAVGSTARFSPQINNFCIICSWPAAARETSSAPATWICRW